MSRILDSVRRAVVSVVPAQLLLLMAFSLLLLLIACANDGDDATHESASRTARSTDAEQEGVVVLDTAGVRLAGIVVAPAESIAATSLPVTGIITYDANRVSHVGPRTAGRITAIRTDLGRRVRLGQVLAVLESADVGQLRAAEREAEELMRIARENYAREQRLAEQGISSRKELLDAEAQLRRSEAALRSTQEQLRVLGAAHDHGAGGEFAMVAPFAGTVVARDASLGEMTSSADTLFTIADLSEVWIELDVYERDLARVRTGQAVAVTVTAYPARAFPGRIVYIGDVLDPAKRTVRARVEIPNPTGALKPGMFATAGIQVATEGHMAVVPLAALQEVEGRTVVFVPGREPGEFRAIPVEIGETIDASRVAIRSGLTVGSRVVVAGAFSLRSELGKAEIDGHGH